MANIRILTIHQREERKIVIGLQSTNYVMFHHSRHFVCKIHEVDLFQQKQQSTLPFITYFRRQK